jgi:putative protease
MRRWGRFDRRGLDSGLTGKEVKIMPEEKLGEVSHYFGKIGVAAVKITSGTLNVGDTIRIKGKTTDLEQTIESIQIEHDTVESAKIGDDIGIKVTEKVRVGDEVFRIVP